jgi:hypothetical protein
MPQPDRIVYGTVTVGTVTVRAMLRTLASGQRLWRSIGALRWQPLSQVATFIPDAAEPQDAEISNAVRDQGHA